MCLRTVFLVPPTPVPHARSPGNVHAQIIGGYAEGLTHRGFVGVIHAQTTMYSVGVRHIFGKYLKGVRYRHGTTR